MSLLILGLALWVVPHFLKSLAPDLRARWGEKAKGPLSLAMVLGIVLMVVGLHILKRMRLTYPPVITIAPLKDGSGVCLSMIRDPAVGHTLVKRAAARAELLYAVSLDPEFKWDESGTRSRTNTQNPPARNR